MMDCQITEMERHAVNCHRERLSKEQGVEVSYEKALEDWLANEAVAWREERQRKCLAQQREEINRHKWIESEKAGHDLGKVAVMDWISNNAAAWRQWYERECLDS